MKEQELDTIIRLIPTATVRQTEIIVGQIDIHLKMLENHKQITGKPHKLVEKDNFDMSFRSIFKDD